MLRCPAAFVDIALTAVLAALVFAAPAQAHDITQPLTLNIMSGHSLERCTPALPDVQGLVTVHVSVNGHPLQINGQPAYVLWYAGDGTAVRLGSGASATSPRCAHAMTWLSHARVRITLTTS